MLDFREYTDSADGEMRDSCSESCSDESELWRWDGCSSEEGSGSGSGGFEQESMWQLNDRLGYLYCQYIERSTPYARVPLMDKVYFLIKMPHYITYLNFLFI